MANKKIAGIAQASAKTLNEVSLNIGRTIESLYKNDSSLIGYWKLNGNNTDSKGGLSCTDYNISYVAGKFGQAASFNGSSSRIDITNSTAYDVTNLTISAWVYATNFVQSGFIFEKGPVNSQYSLFFEGSNVVFRTYNSVNSGDSFVVATGSLGISNNKWNHIACTYDGYTKKIYVNGYLAATKAYTETLRTGQDSQRIGAYGGGGGNYFYNGQIEDLAVFNRALTAIEIQRIYGANIHKVSSVVNTWKPTDISGCKVWIDPSVTPWRDGDDVSGLTDLSGNGNNLVSRSAGQNPHFTPLALNMMPGMNHTSGASSTWDINWNYAAPCTFFYVARMTGGADGRLLSGRGNNWLMGYWGGYRRQMYAEGWVGANSDVSADTATHIWSAVVNSTSSLWEDGVLVKQGTGGVTAPAGLTIGVNGTGEFSNGNVGEIIAYNRELTTAERQQVENYLAQKWSRRGENYLNPATSAVDARNANPSIATGWKWIKTSAMANPVQIWCNYDWHGGGWMRLNSSIATLSSDKGSSPYFYTDGGTWNDAVIGNNVGSGCGDGRWVCRVMCNKLNHTEAMVLIWRETTIIQCLSFGGQTAQGYHSGSYHNYPGSYTSLSFCNWGDNIWAGACCSEQIGSYEHEFVAFCTGAANFDIGFSSQCSSSADNGRYLNCYYVR